MYYHRQSDPREIECLSICPFREEEERAGGWDVERLNAGGREGEAQSITGGSTWLRRGRPGVDCCCCCRDARECEP